MGGPPSEKYRAARQVGLLTTIPILLAAAPLIGYFLGHRVDRWLGTDPWFSMILLVLGIVAGIRETILILRKASRDT